MSQSQTDLWKPPSVRWPAPGKADVTLGAGGRTAVAGQPVRIGRPVAAQVGKVTSELMSRAHAKVAGVSGLMVGLTRTGGVTAAAPGTVEVDYSALRNAFGSDYARRLRLVDVQLRRGRRTH